MLPVEENILPPKAAIEDGRSMQTLLREYRQSDAFLRQFGGRVAGREYKKVHRYGAPLGSIIETHDRLPRCMDRLKELIDAAGPQQKPLPSGAVVMAGELAGGSGRFGREWHAPCGGLWFALAWTDCLLPEFARLLPLAAGTACCEAVRVYGVDAAVKWVNDLHVRERKLGGILCETYSGREAADRYHLIGIGINVNNSRFPAELAHSACSMRGILGRPVDLVQLAVLVLAGLGWHLGLVHLLEEQDLERRHTGMPVQASNPVTDAWRRVSDTPGRFVQYGYDVVRHPLYRATVLDIAADGSLVLQTPDGRRITESGGEIIYLS